MKTIVRKLVNWINENPNDTGVIFFIACAVLFLILLCCGVDNPLMIFLAIPAAVGVIMIAFMITGGIMVSLENGWERFCRMINKD